MALFKGGMAEGNRFFESMVAQAAKALEGIEFLERSLERVDAAAVAGLRRLADEAGELRRVMNDELHRTFVTPIDREDLYNLSMYYEDMMKYALTTMEEMQLFRVEADEPIRSMVRLMREQTEALHFAIQRLARHPRVAEDHATAVHAMEREVERVYRDGIHALFAHAADPSRLPDILYRREVYRHISNMSDRADAAARMIGMVVMKLS